MSKEQTIKEALIEAKELRSKMIRAYSTFQDVWDISDIAIMSKFPVDESTITKVRVEMETEIETLQFAVSSGFGDKDVESLDE